VTLFVSNLHYDLMDETAIRTLFLQYGQVIRVFLGRDEQTDKSKGWGFVELTTQEEGDRAIAELDKTALHGRTLHVTEAKERGYGYKG
jgi:RNA recognition motif-containing protein